MEISWETLLSEMRGCNRCRLGASRTQAVPGEGSPASGLMLIGEGPGRDEDMLGRPFVGAAGQLLEKTIAAIGHSRDTLYITNIVKCRPPGNRAPEPDEAEACMPFLRLQVALLRPKIIVLMGATALRAILGDSMRITRDRGQFIERKGVLFMPTFHPAALLRDEDKKRPFWEDFKKVRDMLAEIPEGRQGASASLDSPPGE